MIYYLCNSIFSLELVHSIPSCITFSTNLSEIDGHQIDESHTIYYHGWKKIIYLLILFPRLVVLEEDLDKVSPLTVARMYDVCHAQHVLNILWWPKSLIAVVLSNFTPIRWVSLSTSDLNQSREKPFVLTTD